MDKIILYGMRWSGKSTIWKVLAWELWIWFIDLDIYLEEKAGEKISEYVKENGWDSFRDLEHECLKEVLNIPWKYVISLWGWTIIFGRNRKEIQLINDKKLIFIEVDLEKIAQRIDKDEKNNNTRPTLTWKWTLEELQEVYNDREFIYKENADEIITNNWTIDEVIKNIKLSLLKNKVCIPIVNFEENYLEETFDKIQEIDEIEFVELRIDFLKNLKNLEKIISSCPKKTIITNRIKREWWNFEWSLEETLNIQNTALKKWAYLIDLELQTLENLENIIIDNSKLIISHHNFEKTPELNELIEVLKKMEKFNPKIFKIALKANNKEDLKTIYDLVSYFRQNYKNKDFIFISMWEHWVETRINIPKLWWFLSFWSFWWTSSAPGQIDYKELYEKILS